MMTGLAHALARRNPRERLLLALLLLVVVPAALVMLVALPMIERQAQAQAALAAAQDTRAWYLTQQSAIARLPLTEAAPAPEPRSPVGLGGIEDRLIDAGLRDAVTLLANTQGDTVTLTLAAVPFADLMGLIDGIVAQAGYRLSALRLERGFDGGLVDAEIRLEPQT